ncbi:unnamed protein product [Rotaria sp. Silwood1]|nr:unnamed protein product [Rotaria sp. Silwood1]CAF1556921.1 unnamed protein product [Rotaria sp. Silwood1]CAF3675006.1 unnamed protein product [Rotaria sp. Silwood1]CAF3741761.1 unnamed protein product [Rotaria sp. Silwood1]CAF3780206.1 unnamed protein product [Rotaria sp. Silwood1]
MQNLQDCCIKLYTKDSFLFHIVNNALRDDDRTKLDTLGPYCYLLYNYIGRHTKHHCCLLIFYRIKSRSITVYRGDHASDKLIAEYRQGTGRKEIYFKWNSIVSTSFDRTVAQVFSINVLYVIKIERYSCIDQYTILKENTYFQDEREVLLRAGIRFRVIKVEFDIISGRHEIHTKIVPSYLSNLL